MLRPDLRAFDSGINLQISNEPGLNPLRECRILFSRTQQMADSVITSL